MRLIALLTLLVLVDLATADEGMWQPAQLPQIAEQLKETGLKIDPESLSDLTAHPMNAIVGLGFCSAAFVSPEGLVLTNHHCAYGSIQYNATPERDLLAEGFVARSRAEELPAAPTTRVYVTRAVSDVSDRINGVLTVEMDGAERHEAIEQEEKRIVAECEADGGHRCEVYSFFGGYRFKLIKRLELKDVRLVYAPPQAIGKFGGDVDNWMWPRHTGDFAFFRAYTGSDGGSAEYSEDNVPYRSESHLEINPKGLAAGDYAMVIGYPGRTARYKLGREVEEAINWTYPTRIETYGDWVAIIEELGQKIPQARISYAGLLASLNNALKNARGMLDGFAGDDVVGRRAAEARTLREWLERSQTRASLYLNDLIALEDALDRQMREQRRRFRYDNVTKRGALLNAARTLYRLAHEKAKPDLEREPGYQQRDLPRIRAAMQQLQRRYHPAVDQALLSYNLKRYAALPPEQRVRSLDQWLEIDGLTDPDLDGLEQRLSQAYQRSELDQEQTRLTWMEAESAAFEASDDPFIALAVALYQDDLAMEQADDARKGELQKLRASYMEALLSYQRKQGVAIYDDANGSLRVSYGKVRGYEPADAVAYLPFTTLAGILAKHTGADPFDATQDQLDRIRTRSFGPYADETLASVPVNFLADLDITGGNSGSPTLDASGRLVGVVFDGNYESIYSDWSFNPDLTRSIHVDVRYMLWLMDAVFKADHLLEEMGVKPVMD